jgi:hypothetical protein
MPMMSGRLKSSEYRRPRTDQTRESSRGDGMDNDLLA